MNPRFNAVVFLHTVFLLLISLSVIYGQETLCCDVLQGGTEENERRELELRNEEAGGQPRLNCSGVEYRDASEEVSHRYPPGSGMFWVSFFVSIGSILFAGLMSGLTVGLMALDVNTLNVISATATTEKERNNARKLIPILRKPHFLLVTLLLANAIAMEALPIFLDRIVSSVAAVAISVSAVLVFGEIIPQVLFSFFLSIYLSYYLHKNSFVTHQLLGSL